MDLKNNTKEELEALITEYESRIAKLNNRQMAIKILINAEYGALANVYFRYYDIRLASAVTLSGQWAIKWIENYLMKHPLQKKYKWEVIYEDTDSIYLSFKYVVDTLKAKHGGDQHKIVKLLNVFSEKVVQPIIDEGYQKLAEYCNANENRMFMKQEKISVNGLWTKKKKYALRVLDNEGVQYKEPKLKIKGIEVVRSSTPKLIKARLKKAIELILTDKELLRDYILETQKIFYESKPIDIAFGVSVNTLSKYETTMFDPLIQEEVLTYKSKGTTGQGISSPIGVRAAIIYNAFIVKNDLYNKYPEIREGEKIKYIYLKVPNPLYENIIGFVKNMPVENDLWNYIDYETQFYKSFFKPIETLTEVVDVMLSMEKYADIDDLFE